MKKSRNIKKSIRGIAWQIPKIQKDEEDAWLMVYLDVITLVLCVFVVLLALSGGPSQNPGPNDTIGGDHSQKDLSQNQPVTESENDFGSGIGDLGGSIDVIKRKNGVSFRISNDMLFNSGDAALEQKGFNELQKIVPFLLDSDYKITVAGHTDNVPIRTERFPSNWELSSARAGSVVRYFESQGVASARLVATGHADTIPLDENSTNEGRAKNRRVELILEDISDEEE